jgi:hypothetical protein
MANSPKFRLKSPAVLQLSESDVTKACLDLLRLHHWWPIRQHVGLFKTKDKRWIRIGESGDPDYVVVRAPSFFLELKRPGGELSLEQIARIHQLRQFYRLETVVVESVEELMEWLARYERSP